MEPVLTNPHSTVDEIVAAGSHLKAFQFRCLCIFLVVRDDVCIECLARRPGPDDEGYSILYHSFMCRSFAFCMQVKQDAASQLPDMGGSGSIESFSREHLRQRPPSHASWAAEANGWHLFSQTLPWAQAALHLGTSCRKPRARRSGQLAPTPSR